MPKAPTSLLTSLLGRPSRRRSEAAAPQAAEALATVGPQMRISEATGGWLSGGPTSAAGTRVDEDSAMSLSSVFAAVNLLSRIMSTLPLCVYRKDGRRREPATTNPAYRVLHDQLNPEMTAATGRRVMDFWRLLGGAACGEIGWAGSGSPRAVWPLESYRVKPKRDRDTNALYYEVDGKRRVAPEDMIYVPLVSTDGVSGRSFLDFAVDSLGLGLATQEFASRYFGNGARPGVVLEHPGSPTKEARQEFKRSWNETHGGPSNVGKTAVLWGGWTYKPDGSFDPEKSQLIEQRKFTTEEVARWLNIPPHLLRELSRATFSNIEQQGIDFVLYSLGPTLVEYEQEYDRRLLSPPGLYCKHNVAALLRGDSAARSAYFRELWGIGVLSINDILELEDSNPIEGGDTHFVPANMMTLDKAINPPEPAPAPAPGAPPPAQDPTPAPAPDAQAEHNSRARAAVSGLLASTLGRLAGVEGNALRRAAEKPGRLLAWMEEFYARHEQLLAEALAPVAAAAGLLGLALDPAGLAAEWCRDSRAQVLDMSGCVTRGGLALAAGRLAEDWAGARGPNAACILFPESIHAQDPPRP